MSHLAKIVFYLCMTGLVAYYIKSQHAEELAYIQHGYCREHVMGEGMQWVKCKGK